MSDDEATVRELFAPSLARSIDLEGKHFKVNRERVVATIRSAPQRALAARAARGRRTVIVAMAAGLAVVSSVAWLRLRSRSMESSSEQSLTIKGVHGVVTRSERGSAFTRMPSGEPVMVSAASELVTAARSDATVGTREGLEIKLFENSRLSLAGLEPREPQPRSTVALAAGAIRCQVPPLAPGKQFAVITPDATVVVHGTVFRVAVRGTAGEPPPFGRTCVQVEEGEVLVKTAAADKLLGAGQSWGCAAPSETAAVAPPPLEKSGERAASAGARSTKPQLRETTKAISGTLDEENALFQAGLSAERRGDARAAAASFELLLARYPASPLAADARGALARVKRNTNPAP